MKIILTLLACLLSSSSLADQFYLTVGLECNEKKSELSVWFNGSWDEKGEAAIAALTENQWNPRELISFVQNNDTSYSITRKTVKTSCRIDGYNYKIIISPLLAPRFHPEGHCASRVGASVTIKQGKSVVVSRGVDACTEVGLVPTRIKVKPNHSVAYTEVPAEYSGPRFSDNKLRW